MFLSQNSIQVLYVIKSLLNDTADGHTASQSSQAAFPSVLEQLDGLLVRTG